MMEVPKTRFLRSYLLALRNRVFLRKSYRSFILFATPQFSVLSALRDIHTIANVHLLRLGLLVTVVWQR